MRNKYDLEFDGQRLSGFGAVLSETPHYTIAIKDIEFTSLPGKSGDIITDNGRYKNKSITYKITSMPFEQRTEQEFVFKLSEWLMTAVEYKILRDTYTQGYYRKAICTSVSDPIVEASGMVTVKVTFNCEPFLYSDTGSNKISLVSSNNAVSTTITNPEMWSSEPIIKINGGGDFTVAVNDVSLTITDISNYVVIDKQSEDVYDSNGSCSDRLSALSLPCFKAGINSIIITGTNSFTVDIMPNWRRL